MQYRDKRTGQVVPNDVVKKSYKREPMTHPLSGPMTIHTPDEVASQVGNAAQRMLAPGAATAVGARGGTLAGEGLAAGLELAGVPETGGLSLLPAVLPPVLGALGAGTANMEATERLPYEWGGNPEQSRLNAFLWGSVPELAIGGIAAPVLQNKLENRASEAVLNQLHSELKAPPSAGEGAESLATALDRGQLGPSPRHASHESQTAQKFAVRDSMLNPLDRERERLGEPIGDAYKKLKNPGLQLSPAEGAELAEAAHGIEASALAPYPEAQATLRQLQSLAPPPGEVSFEPRTLTQQKLAAMTPEQQKFFQALEKSHPSSAPSTEMPTLDKLRELRQKVNILKQKSTSGGNIYALKELEQAIDEKLMPYLPDDIRAQHASYASFMQDHSWREIRNVRGMGLARLRNWAFGGDPAESAERLNSIARVANDKEKKILADSLTEHLMKGVDVRNMTAAQQVEQVRSNMKPYFANGTMDMLYGGDALQTMRQIAFAPAHRADLALALEQPKNRQVFMDEWKKAYRAAPKDQQAAFDRGWNAFLQSMPEADRGKFLLAPVPGAEMPVAPTTEQAMALGMQPNPAGHYGAVPLAKRRGPIVLSSAGSRLLAGSNPALALAAPASVGVVLLSDAGWRAIMDAGMAPYFAKALASPSIKMSAHGLFNMIAAFPQQEMWEGDEGEPAEADDD